MNYMDALVSATGYNVATRFIELPTRIACVSTILAVTCCEHTALLAVFTSRKLGFYTTAPVSTSSSVTFRSLCRL